MKEEVHMGVDQSRHQGGVAKVDRLRSSGMGDGRSGGNHLAPLHQDLTRRNNAAGFNIEQARGMEYDRAGGSLCPGRWDQS
jgi:hypothetical protein